MRRYIRSLALSLALSTPLLGSPGHATTVLKVGVADMTRMSEWVVKARVLAVDNVAKTPSGDGPFTDVRLSVDAVYAGPTNAQAPRELVVRLMGGRMDDGLAMKVPGMPRFAVGDEAVFFLERTATGLLPCGLEQGVWRLVQGPFGYEVVQQTVFDTNLVIKTTDGRLVPDRHGAQRDARVLGALVAEIRAALPR